MGIDIKQRIIIFTISIVLAVLFLVPTFMPGFFGERWISRPISLGLDLSGGVHLVYNVEADEAVISRLQSTASAIRSDLRSVGVPVARSRVNERGELELVLVSDRNLQLARDTVQQRFKELSFLRQSEDAGRVSLLYGLPEAQRSVIEREAVVQAVETLRNRVDQFGVAEPLIQRVGFERILLQMPGVQDIEAVKRIVGAVARLEFRLLPVSQAQPNVVTMQDRQGNPILVEDEALMTGDAVDTARAEFFEGQVEVSLGFTTDGGRTFARITGDNVGRNLAIILDGVVYSSPQIRERISGGRASISGGFSLEEAHQLAVVLRAGALPAPLTVMEERTVGPTLGQESIRRGVWAIAIGFFLIVVFMLVYYKKAGIIASAALIINILLVMAVLSAFGATLTLPGLAGLALTVGMAVDANVIIFERIREELRNGSGRNAAVSSGFERATKAIVDANITTLLAGIILFWFGTGPIRGFAVTLSIGILTTLYCATFISRLAFDYFELKGSEGKTLSI
jgi:preprotein translocase subunit SecD